LLYAHDNLHPRLSLENLCGNWNPNRPTAERIAEKVAQPLLAVRFSFRSPMRGTIDGRQDRTGKSACATKTFPRAG
jgi:hypothetical protein